MKIEPLLITNVNWTAFQKLSIDVLGVNPTRPLDDAGIDLKDEAAFARALSFDCAKLDPRSMKHTYAGFVIEGNKKLLATLSQTDLNIFVKCGEWESMMIIATGSVYSWLSSMKIYPEISYFWEEVSIHLNRAGFKI